MNNVTPFPRLKYGAVYGPQGERITVTRRIRKALERRSVTDAALGIARLRGYRAPAGAVIPFRAVSAAPSETFFDTYADPPHGYPFPPPKP